MKKNKFDNKNTDQNLEQRRLIPHIFYKNKIYTISNPKLFLVLYKIGKLYDFIKFSDIKGYDETKIWLQEQHLLNEFFLENVSICSVFCKIKYSSKLRFFTKNSFNFFQKYELN